jgi:transposase InsO family protein
MKKKYVKFGNMRKEIAVLIPENKDEALMEIYKTFKMNGRDSFYEAVRQKYYISRADCFEFLKKQETYQLHVLQKRESSIKPLFIKKINSLWQFDLIILKNLSSPQNNNVKYILTVIDVFSRYAFVKGLTTKKKDGIQKAFEEFFLQNGNYPASVQSDNAKEFIALTPFFHNLGIKHIFSETYLPQQNSYIERFNRTLKQMIFLHITATKSNKYVYMLPEFIKSYNNSVHSGIKNKPVVIHKENRENITQIELNAKKRDEYLRGSYDILQKNDKVRLHILTRAANRKKDKFAKKYIPQWSKEVYFIEKVIKGENTRPTYEINGKRFHRHNLQLIK